ncbi:MAG: hypothetical protein JJT78_11975 [Leptospira sp.]|nr:hypothetical protein [Leptospira sp.]
MNIKSLSIAIFVLTISIFSFHCVKERNQEEEDILLFLLNKSNESPLRDSCLDWSFAEWECVQDGDEKSKDVSILSECNQERIESFRLSLLPESKRSDENVRTAYSCLVSCNRNFHLAIQCPAQLRFRSIEEYRKPRSESTSIFHQTWQKCNLKCRLQGNS